MDSFRRGQLLYLATLGRSLALFAVLGLAWARPGFGQGMRIEGVVRDSSGASVPGAQVKLSANSYSATTSTDAAGAFAFDGVPSNSGLVTVTAKGFQPVQQNWTAASGTPSQISIVLQPLAVSQQVTVTAARTATPLGASPISDIQLSADDLQATPALTLDDALRQVPGFSLFRRTSSRTANPTTLGISLRGLGANGASRALVLEDGLPLNDPFGSWVYWDRVPSVSVSSVEVAQEGASSLYPRQSSERRGRMFATDDVPSCTTTTWQKSGASTGDARRVGQRRAHAERLAVDQERTLSVAPEQIARAHPREVAKLRAGELVGAHRQVARALAASIDDSEAALVERRGTPAVRRHELRARQAPGG